MMCLTDPFGSWFNALFMTNNGEKNVLILSGHDGHSLGCPEGIRAGSWVLVLNRSDVLERMKWTKTRGIFTDSHPFSGP